MIKDCLDALTKLREALMNSNYSIWRHEGILDSELEVSGTWDDFESLSSDEWAELRCLVDSTTATALLIYSMRMSMLAVRGRDEGLLRNAVMALIVDDHVVDDQDTQARAALVYDAATRIGADAEALFRTAILYATRGRRQLLEGYLRGPTYVNSIRSMGYEGVETGLGFVYRLRLDDLPGWPTKSEDVEDLIHRLTSKSDNLEKPDTQ